MAFEETKSLIQQLVQQKIVPGVSSALIDGAHTYISYLGDQQWLPEVKKLQPNYLYDLASLTKVMTTTPMILKLIQAQQLSLTTPIRRFLPGFQDERVQIWHLLTHTSGIGGYIPHRNELPPAELKQALLHLGVGPGFEQRVKYTDIGLIFLGYIIEAIYHEPVQKTLTQEILVPLNLNNTTFAPDPRLAIPTTYDDQTGLLRGIVHDPKARILGSHCASAGLFSNLADVVQFTQWILGQYQPETAPLDQGTIQSLFHNYSQLPNQPRSLGWDIRLSAQDQHVLLYHTGYTGTFLIIDRQNQNALVVLTNRVHPKADNQAFLDQRDRIVDAFCQESCNFTV
ncbi:serine hydrolase domain-containing protein [Agrilactobacillus fermenti]|uniref:serine hydrolase domain-containing protein n=1 Tax=Agrilactobacillus fermenti TaxID=2586909 RepID=UPI003A5BBA0D